MRLHKISFLFSIAFLFLTRVHADISVDVIRDEDYIPFYAVLQKDISAGSVQLRTGERMIVLRPMAPDSIRVDVPRNGIFTIPVDTTDLAMEIERVKQSTDENFKLIPRMALFLTNRMMSGESGWQNPLPTEVVYAFERWILLYGDAREESTQAAVAEASELYSSLPEGERIQTALLFMDIVGDKAAIQALANAVQPTIQCMPGYLSRGYVRSLDQIESGKELPQLVEVASSGRILNRVIGIEAVRLWLDKE